jgi:hypothetical protein
MLFDELKAKAVPLACRAMAVRHLAVACRKLLSGESEAPGATRAK